VWPDLLDEHDNGHEDDLWDAHELSGCSPAANTTDLNPMDIRNTTLVLVAADHEAVCNQPISNGTTDYSWSSE
jgi:ferritin-like protein